MRILILGNNHTGKSFYDHLSKNKDNIVFSNCTNAKNYIQFDNLDDIADFSETNEINFILICDDTYINTDALEKLGRLNNIVFSPSEDAINIVKYKSYAKKFINKNKFLSPRFFIADKPNLALDYIQNTNFPLVIRPDIHNYKECSQFCETFGQAKKLVNDFFESGNKKIIIEEYIQGKNVSIWTISDGYKAKIIGTNAKYQNDVSVFEPEFVTNEQKEAILNNIINPAIESLGASDCEYIGILGFDFIINSKQEAYLLGFNNFFDDISADFFTNLYNIDWLKIFESCIIGDIFLKYKFDMINDYAITIRQDGEIKFLSAKTKTNLERYLNELNFDTKEYMEAQKIWKY